MTSNRRQVMAGAAALSVAITSLDARAASTASRSLMIIGDWGRERAPHQRDVAAQMNITAGKRACVGIVAVGDNFYEDGVQSVDDPKWRLSFEDVYSGEHIKPLPWYVALGNHDYGGVPQAQVDYTFRSDRWHMPARFFKVAGAQLGLPDVDLFVIDTNPLIADNATGNNPLAVNVRSQDGEAQLAWLDRKLAASKAKFKFVAGHHTVYSGGSLHGDNADLIAKLLPILKRYGVTAYLNGHDHDLQHIARDGMHFICSGAGSEARPVHAISGTQFCLAQSGFAILAFTEDRVVLEFCDYAGTSRYQARLS